MGKRALGWQTAGAAAHLLRALQRQPQPILGPARVSKKPQMLSLVMRSPGTWRRKCPPLLQTLSVRLQCSNACSANAGIVAYQARSGSPGRVLQFTTSL